MLRMAFRFFDQLGCAAISRGKNLLCLSTRLIQNFTLAAFRQFELTPTFLGRRQPIGDALGALIHHPYKRSPEKAANEPDQDQEADHLPEKRCANVHFVSPMDMQSAAKVSPLSLRAPAPRPTRRQRTGCRK